MAVNAKVIIDAMEKWAPPHLAESWDNVGLQLGSPLQSVRKILVALDVSQQTTEYAQQHHFDMIIAHHPLVFKPIKNLRTDLPQGRLLAALLKADIAVFAAHTNLDITEGGVNDVLAAKLQLAACQPLAVTQRERLFKIVVFVPPAQADAVGRAMGDAGAGHIGQYSHCQFTSAGTGSFLPLPGATPFIGEVGCLEQTAEVRIETIVPERMRSQVLAAMLAAHPYEEVAYDLYPLENSGRAMGLGRIGQLTAPMSLAACVEQVKQALAIPHVRVAGARRECVQTVAVCGGSGASLIGAAAAAGADVLVTGDVKYHEAQAAAEAGIVLLDAGHFATERPVVDAIVQHLRACAAAEDWLVEVTAYPMECDAFTIY